MRSAAICSAARASAEMLDSACCKRCCGSSSAATLSTVRRSKRRLYSSRAASPRCRTVFNISATVLWTCWSETESHASSAASSLSKPAVVVERRRIFSTGAASVCALRYGSLQAIDNALHASVLAFHRGLVDDQARADVGNQFERLHAIGPQAIAGVDDADDEIGESLQRRQLHRAVQL